MGRNNMFGARAGATLAPSSFVSLSTASDNVVIQSTSGQAAAGVTQIGMRLTPGVSGSDNTQAATSGEAIMLYGLGDVAEVRVGSVASVGNNAPVTSDTNGFARPATSSTGDFVSGRATQSGATGALILIQLQTPHLFGTGENN